MTTWLKLNLKTAAAEIKPEELINEIKKDTFDFNPGEKWTYNNSGFFILGYIVEKVSGQSYGDYLLNQFFKPLGITNSCVHAYQLIFENEATGYAYENGTWQKALNWDMLRAGNAGALYSTVADLYRWNEAVFNNKVLQKSSQQTAFTPVTLNDGTRSIPGGGGYGYGWVLGEFRSLEEIQHGGGLYGFNSNLTRLPEQNFTVVVLVNSLPMPANVSASGVAHEIARIYLWEQLAEKESYAVAATVDPKLYDDYVGRYKYPGNVILMVTREDNRLFARMTGQSKFEIFPKSETVFFYKVVSAKITFEKNKTGQVTHLTLVQAGMTIKALKK